jgi:hypothetical protein
VRHTHIQAEVLDEVAAHPSNRWMMNANWFQIVMLAYNLNCWLLLFNRKQGASVETMRHTTLATARLRFLFLAPGSGAMPEGWVSATATITRRKTPFSV